MVVRPGNLHCDRTEGSWGVPGTEDIFLPEAVPFDRRQNTYRRGTRLLQGVVTQRGDSESACCSSWFPAKVNTFFSFKHLNLDAHLSPVCYSSQVTQQVKAAHKSKICMA